MPSSGRFRRSLLSLRRGGGIAEPVKAGDLVSAAPAAARRRRRPSPELLVAIALACIYAATMSGHLESIDGLLMYWQARALLYHQALHFGPIDWGIPFTTSLHGIGLPLAYLPGFVLFSWLAPHSPSGTAGPYNWALYYTDPLYTVAGAPVHILITAATAYVIGRFLRTLGFGQRIVSFGMLAFGLASPALVYARGDFAQPLDGLCSIAALYAAYRYRANDHGWPPWTCGLWLGWAVLSRPVEGSLLLPILLLLLAPPSRPEWWRSVRWSAIAVVIGSYLAAVAVTLLVNWGRYGSPLTSGYGAYEGWTNPLWLGLPGTLISPGRGIIWEFPALLLAPLGVRALGRPASGRLAWALAIFAILLLLNAATWYDWVGGWTWGLRLLVPALPALAILSAAGLATLRSRVRPWVAALLFLGGLIWAIPGVVTDLLAGYGGAYAASDANFSLNAYPPIGAWHWVHHWFASTPTDPNGVDILWFRLADATGGVSLLAPVLFLVAAGLLVFSARPFTCPCAHSALSDGRSGAADAAR